MRSADMSPILALLAALAVNVGTFYSLPGPPEKLMQPFNLLESSSLLTDACANPHDGSTDEAGSCRLCQTASTQGSLCPCVQDVHGGETTGTCGGTCATDACDQAGGRFDRVEAPRVQRKTYVNGVLVDAPSDFLGIADWSHPENGDFTNYFIGVYFQAAVFVVFSLIALFSSCFFCASRCPCNRDHVSGDSTLVSACSCCVCWPYCVPLASDESFTWMCIKACCFVLPLKLCCCTCSGPNCLCCCPSGSVVWTSVEGYDGGDVTIFSGGLTAEGSIEYTHPSMNGMDAAEGQPPTYFRTEKYSCCGGVYPSVQYGSLAVRELGLCCDVCCGVCDCCNPCCRMNMLDFERATGHDPGYSLMFSRVMKLAMVVVVILAFVGLGLGVDGSLTFACGIEGLFPALIQMLAVVVFELATALEGLAAIANQLAVVAILVGTGSTATLAVTNLQTTVVDGFTLLQIVVCQINLYVIYGITTFFVPVITATLYVPVICLVTGLAGVCPKLDRVALICGTLCLLTIFYSAIAVLIFDPLAMIINDLCDVLESVRVQGALKGFPGNETLPQCGPTGQFSKVADTAQNFVDESSSLLCASFGQACNAGTPVAFLSNQLSLVLKLPGCCEDSSQSCRFQDFAYDQIPKSDQVHSNTDVVEKKVFCPPLVPATVPLAHCPSTIETSPNREWCKINRNNFTSHVEKLHEQIRFENVYYACPAHDGVVLTEDDVVAGNVGASVTQPDQKWIFSGFDTRMKGDGVQYFCDVHGLPDWRDATDKQFYQGDIWKCKPTLLRTADDCLTSTSTNTSWHLCSSVSVNIRNNTSPKYAPIVVADTTCDATLGTCSSLVAKSKSCASMKVFGNSVGWANDYVEIADGCSHTCNLTTAQLVGNCSGVCERRRGPIAMVSQLKIEQCTGYLSRSASGNQYGIPECNNPYTLRFAKSILEAELLDLKTRAFYYTGYLQNVSVCTADVQSACTGGNAVRSLVDCAFMPHAFEKITPPLCSSAGTGLKQLATAFQLFFWSYIFGAALLIFGYKRWKADWIKVGDTKEMEEAAASQHRRRFSLMKINTRAGGYVDNLNCAPMAPKQDRVLYIRYHESAPGYNVRSFIDTRANTMLLNNLYSSKNDERSGTELTPRDAVTAGGPITMTDNPGFMYSVGASPGTGGPGSQQSNEMRAAADDLLAPDDHALKSGQHRKSVVIDLR